MERRRSPRYPFINLEKALALARKLPPNNWIASQEAAAAWGKDETSSRVAQTISALREFALVEVRGHRPSRQLHLTGLARHLLETGDDRALRDAALRPGVFEELWREIQSRKTSHAALVQLLTTNRDYPFNPRAAEEVLRLFAETLRFAQLPEGPNGDLTELIQRRTAIVAEEVLAMGKIRIQYRGTPDRKDLQQLRDHFDSKLRHTE